MGVSSRAVLELIKAMDGKRNEVHGFMLERDGVVIAESWLAPYKPEYPHTCHSLGKSYTCTAIGVAVTKGLVSVEDKIVDIFKDEIELFGIEPDDLYTTLRLRDVMGHEAADFKPRENNDGTHGIEIPTTMTGEDDID